MKVITNILISVLSFAISYGIAHLTGSVIVKNAVLLAYVIHWIAYIPAYVFQIRSLTCFQVGPTSVPNWLKIV